MRKIILIFLTGIFLLSSCTGFPIKRPETSTADLEILENINSYHYYNSLNSKQRIAYKNMEKAVNQYEIQATFPILTKEEIVEAVNALYYDHPLMFCIRHDFEWGQNKFCSYVHFDYLITKDEYVNRVRQVNDVLDETMQQINNKMNDYEKELFLHDWLLNHCKYYYDEESEDSYTAYGALVKGQSMCEGFSKGMMLLLQKAGIPNFIITGLEDTRDPSSGHMWNIVNIEGENYHLDATWDLFTENNLIHHSYFNLSDKQISIDHFKFSLKNSYCKAIDNNYYIKNGTFFSSFEKAKKALPHLMKNFVVKNIDRIEIKMGTSDIYFQMKKLLLSQEEFYELENGEIFIMCNDTQNTIMIYM